MADPETGEYTFGNRALETLIGGQFPVGEKYVDSLRSVVALEAGTGRRLAVSEYPSSRAARGEDIKDYRFIWRTLNGDLHVSVTSSRIAPAFGNPGRIILAVHDISALMLAQQAQVNLAQELSLDRLKLDAMISQSPFAIALTRGPNFIFEKVNANYLELSRSRECLGRAWADVYPELKDTHLPALLNQVFKTGVPMRQEDVKISLHDQHGVLTEQYFSATYDRILSPDGQPYGICIQARRTTQAVLDRERLAESERRLAEAVMVAKVGFFEWDLQNGKIFFSPQMQADWDFVGHTFDEAAARVVPEDLPGVLQKAEEAVQLRKPYHAEYRVVRGDGRVIWIEAQGQVLRDERGEALRLFGTSLDITARKNLEANLRAAKEEADRANATKSAFLANMSHEIRTPLSAILGYADLLEDENLRRETRRQYVSTIARNGKALTRIIDDILDLTKVESGKLEMECTTLSLREIVDEVRDLLQERAGCKGLKLSVDYDPELPEWVSSDPTRIRQILINLVGNAIKFTDHGAVDVTVRKLPPKAAQDCFQIEVRDTGIGIDPSKRNRLFKPFSQTDSATSRKFGGSGLGLALSHRLATALGGDIRLLDQAGKERGSNFAFSFCADRAAPPATSTSEAKSGATNPPRALSGVKVLVADDSPDNQFLATHMLTQAGAEVETADNGQEAFDKALAQTFDVVLMDIQMPLLDGLEATRALRQAGFTKPIVALTAHAMDEERARTREAGCDGHLTKPLNRRDLIQTLGRLTRA